MLKYIVFLSSFILISLLFWILYRFFIGALLTFLKKDQTTSKSSKISPFFFFSLGFLITETLAKNTDPNLFDLKINVYGIDIELASIIFYIHGIFVILATFLVVKVLVKVVNYILEKFVNGQFSADEQKKKSLLFSFKVFINIIFWTLGILFILNQFGINLTGIVTGLGASTLVLGIALRTLISDVFSAIAIYTDKPFIKGEDIRLEKEGIQGTVEDISLRSTKIRSLSGEIIAFANNKILDLPIKNLSRRSKMRKVISLTLDLETNHKQIHGLIAKIQNLNLGLIENKNRLNSGINNGPSNNLSNNINGTTNGNLNSIPTLNGNPSEFGMGQQNIPAQPNPPVQPNSPLQNSKISLFGEYPEFRMVRCGIKDYDKDGIIFETVLDIYTTNSDLFFKFSSDFQLFIKTFMDELKIGQKDVEKSEK